MMVVAKNADHMYRKDIIKDLFLTLIFFYSLGVYTHLGSTCTWNLHSLGVYTYS